MKAFKAALSVALPILGVVLIVFLIIKITQGLNTVDDAERARFPQCAQWDEQWEYNQCYVAINKADQKAIDDKKAADEKAVREATLGAVEPDAAPKPTPVDFGYLEIQVGGDKSRLVLSSCDGVGHRIYWTNQNLFAMDDPACVTPTTSTSER